MTVWEQFETLLLNWVQLLHWKVDRNSKISQISNLSWNQQQIRLFLSLLSFTLKMQFSNSRHYGSRQTLNILA